MTKKLSTMAGKFCIHKNRKARTVKIHCFARFSNEFSPLSFYDRIKSNARPRSNLDQYSPWSRPVRKCSLDERDYSNDPDLLAWRLVFDIRSIRKPWSVMSSFPPREMFSPRPSELNKPKRFLSRRTNDRAQLGPNLSSV